MIDGSRSYGFLGLSDRNHRPKGITKVTVFYFADLTEAVGEASSFVVFRTRLSFDGWLHRVTAVWTGRSLIADLQLALGAFDEHGCTSARFTLAFVERS